MLIGASIGEEDLGTYPQMLAGNNIIRIFPQTWSTNSSFKVLQPWTDARILYCRAPDGTMRTIPFVSTKCDGNDSAIAYVKTQLLNTPSWITTLYITDRHEPEGDVSGAQFQANFTKFLAMIDSLPAGIRARVKCGPILTRTWAEKAGTTRDYDEYDPGTGDFFAVDMYHETGTAGAVVKPSTLIAPATFVARFKAYKKSAGDTRPRLWPELGLIGMPEDLDGTARATWIQGVHDQAKLMRAGQPGWTQPWSFAGWIWWDQIGKATGEVRDVGMSRDFPLHLRSVPDPGKTYTTTNPKTGAVTTHWISHPVDLPGSPPAPVAKFNAIYLAENSTTTTPSPIAVTIGTVTNVSVAQKVKLTGGAAGAGGSYAGSWLLGATMKKADIAEYEPKLACNRMFRVFPNPTTNLPPDWSDPRFAYAQRAGAVPFVSSNLDGDATGFGPLRQWLIDMPAWVKYVYITDRHEPENNAKDGLTVENYRSNFTLWWNEVIEKLPATTRAKVRAGHVLTRQWTENTVGRTYDGYDTGLGDFFAVDMYANTWGSPSSTVATAYPDPVAFVQRFKDYKKTPGDTRDRVWAEWGAVGLPADPDGTARAKWIRYIAAILDTWAPETTGWKFVGAIWWNNQGTTSPTSLTGSPGIGKLRYFYLDMKQTGVDTPPVLIPGSPPAPLAAFNQVALAHQSLDPTTEPADPVDPVPDPGPVDPDPDPDPTPGTEPTPVEPGDASQLPADLPPSARLMAAEYMLLITDRNLTVVGDPISIWTTLDLTLRWNEPSSGQFTAPGYAWVRDQLAPGNRVVCIRRVLGNARVVLAGPIESTQYERSDDGENGGDGTLTVTWSDDLSWVAGRLTYPDPSKTPETQTTDFWTYNGNTELGMLKLVAENAGQLAQAQRAVPRLITAAPKGLSGTVVVSATVGQARFIPVTDCLRDMSKRGGGYGFRTYQTMTAKQIVFEVYRPRDLTKVVRFGFNIGNLKYLNYETSMPELTAVVVGGQYNVDDVAAGADKFVMQVRVPATEATWGRIEAYLPRPGNDPQADLIAEANGALNVDDDTSTVSSDGTQATVQTPIGTAGARLSSTAADTVDQRYGVHYDLGDIVSMEFWNGSALSGPIRNVHIQAWPTAGEVVNTLIGDQDSSHDPVRVAQLRAIDRRVGYLERNVAVKKPTT